MGEKKFDFWSFSHFFSGFYFRFLFFRENIILGFFVSQILHIFTELIEKKEYKNKILETRGNQIFDHISFTLGWLFSQFLINRNPKSFQKLCSFKKTNLILKILFIALLIREITKELFPENKINGVFFATTKIPKTVLRSFLKTLSYSFPFFIISFFLVLKK